MPLSVTALEVLRGWKDKTTGRGLVFTHPKTGKKFDQIREFWNSAKRRANVNNFRWHDLRHTFASRLVMAGVDLNVVRELMGHSDLKMTLRYAHLAPEAKRKAIDLLDE